MNTKDNPFKLKPEDSIGFLLWKTHNYWQREIKKSLKPLDLTHTQFVVLANAQFLLLSHKVITQIEIAKHAHIDVMMTSNVLRLLEKKCFIERKEHPTDTRAKTIHLTKLGIKTLNKAVKNVENFDHLFFSHLKNKKKFNLELNRLGKK